MSLQYMDKKIVAAMLIDAWQNHLGTEMDPADGQWFTNGPGNNGGLYGQLTDALATELVFDESQKVFTPHQLAAQTATVDNRNGKTPDQTVTLAYAYQNQTSCTHSTAHSLKVGSAVDINTKADFFGVGGGVTVKFSVDYTYSWTEATTVSKTETLTFSQQIPLKAVPEGRVYQVVLLCNKDDLKLPYYADVYLKGQSTANFRSPVNGERHWTVDAGTLCEWINMYGSAGADSYMYGRDPNDPTQGLIRLRGTMTATQTANFIAVTKDITDSFKGGGDSQAISVVVDPTNVAAARDIIATQTF